MLTEDLQETNWRTIAAPADCFIHLASDDIFQFDDLIRKYVESAAYPSPHDDLLRQLENSKWRIPDITIRLAEKFVTVCGASAGDISTAASSDAPTVSKLVMRLYTQTKDSDVQRRCLDLIDDMTRHGFYGVGEQLAEHDR